MDTDDDLSVTFAALAEPFQLSLPAVSKHLKVLQRAGLISQGRRAQWRPCRLEPARLKDVSDWLERYRAIWEERFGRLDAYLRELRSERGAGGASDAGEAKEP